MLDCIYPPRGRGMAAYGMLSIDTTEDDPEIQYDIIRIDNTIAGTLVVKKKAS